MRLRATSMPISIAGNGRPETVVNRFDVRGVTPLGELAVIPTARPESHFFGLKAGVPVAGSVILLVSHVPLDVWRRADFRARSFSEDRSRGRFFTGPWPLAHGPATMPSEAGS
jgi:hypothetical protein